MKDVPEPRESSFLVALVEEPDLFFDNVFSLRACILVKVHYKTWVFLTVCKSRPERHSWEGQQSKEEESFGIGSHLFYSLSTITDSDLLLFKQTLPQTHISLLFEQITETQQIIYPSNLTHEELIKAKYVLKH